MFSTLEAYMPHYDPDPLHTFYKRMGFSHDPGFLLNGHSKSARFYRWVKKIKKEWNIKEDKLIVTAIFCLIVTIIMFFLTNFIFISVGHKEH
jgi:hypothetical protein